MTIDKRALDKLASLVGDDGEVLAEIVGSFLEEGPSLFDDLVDANRSSDLTRIRRAAHSIKSNARDMGAVDLAEICARIEEASAAGNPPEASNISQAHAELQSAIAELSAIFKIGVRN